MRKLAKIILPAAVLLLRGREDSEISCYCSQCERELPEERHATLETRKPCPSCGSVGRNFTCVFSVHVGCLASVGGKAKSPGKRRGLSHRPTFHEFKGGQVPSKATPEGWVHIEQSADRAHDSWDHKVTAPDGTVLHEEHERLSEHVAHSDARRAATRARHGLADPEGQVAGDD
jgi:hypothetical protein